MAYPKQTWTDGESQVNAARLNHMETGIGDAHTLAESVQADVAALASDIEVPTASTTVAGKVELATTGETTSGTDTTRAVTPAGVAAATAAAVANRVVATSTITKIHGPITQAAYNALATKDPATFYVIVG